MIRNVDLVSYLPPFLQKYGELSETLAAEDPEFALVWEAADRLLKNAFIETADEYGIRRFEQFLGLYPEKGEPLESRRTRVFLRWFVELPYTWRMFLFQLAQILEGVDVRTRTDFEEGYGAWISASFDGHEDLIRDVRHLIEVMFPANMLYTIDYLIHQSIDESGLERAEAWNVDIRVPVYFWNSRYLDGSFLLDGSCPLDAARDYDLHPRVFLTVPIEMPETFSATLVYHRTDIFLDGSHNLDGTWPLNTVWREEEL